MRSLQRWSASLFGAIAVVSVLLTASTVWLFLTNPVNVVNAINRCVEVSTFVPAEISLGPPKGGRAVLTLCSEIASTPSRPST